MRRHTLTVVIASVSVMVAAYGAATVPDVIQVTQGHEEVMRVLSVMDDAKLRLLCICGSLGGALISILVFPTPRFKPMLFKFVSSSLSGIMFSPWLAARVGIAMESDATLAWSGVVALLSYTVIQAIVPLTAMAAEKWFGIRFLPKDEAEP